MQTKTQRRQGALQRRLHDLAKKVDEATIRDLAIEFGKNNIEMKMLRHKGLCPFCKAVVNENDFQDELSKKEFRISGLCQKCQDEFFADEM